MTCVENAAKKVPKLKNKIWKDGKMLPTFEAVKNDEMKKHIHI